MIVCLNHYFCPFLQSWMTDELFTEVKKKNALYLKAKSSDEQTAWQEFRLQRNRVSSLIKEAKIKAGLITRKVKEVGLYINLSLMNMKQIDLDLK